MTVLTTYVQLEKRSEFPAKMVLGIISKSHGLMIYIVKAIETHYSIISMAETKCLLKPGSFLKSKILKPHN